MKQATRKQSFGLILAVYLAGIFMGAIDTGIVTPARTIIQNHFQVTEQTGIWMITIYTLAYAASIPIMGKLADKYGRKYIYLASILLFGMGSLFCGLSQQTGNFTFLLMARVIQALGGGGIMPVATAEFGTTFPPEKRGLALGLVGGVYGLANIFGASAGSAILDLFGKNNWQYIFYINIPITLFILAAGFVCLPNHRSQDVKKTDISGILLLTAMVLSLLYGLRNIDFFNFFPSLGRTDVYPFLIVFAVLLPFFILAEKRAQDPVMNLGYFTNARILITLFLSFAAGFILMGIIFVPQFSENALKIPSGSGGYFVIALGLFAGVGAPLSGKLIDKFGPKRTLTAGFIISAVGCLFLILVTANHPSVLSVMAGLVIVGLGIGFTMGTPINYMMLENTKKEESNSALAALSLIRSVGTAIAPAIMVGFIAHAGANIQTQTMKLMPQEVTAPQLPYAQELTETFNKLKQDPNMKAKLEGVTIPDFASATTIKIPMGEGSDFKMPQDLLDLMKSSDVTTITKNSKTLAARMFEEMAPTLIVTIQSGIQKGMDPIKGALPEMDQTLSDLNEGIQGLTEAISGMESGMDMQNKAIAQLEAMAQGMASMPSGAVMPQGILTMIPEAVLQKIPQDMLNQLKDVRTPEDLLKMIDGMKVAADGLKAKIAEMQGNLEGMQKARASIQAAKADMTDTLTKMEAMKQAVPETLEQAKLNYLAEIDNRSGLLEAEFQKTLNVGFKEVYLTALAASLLGLLILCFYNRKRETQNSL